MQKWLTLWQCKGHWVSRDIRAIYPAPEEKTSWSPALRGDRPSQSRQDWEQERNKPGKAEQQCKRGFCFPVFTFQLERDLFWLPVKTSTHMQLDLLRGKVADISTGWSHASEVEVARTLALLFYQAMCVGDGGRNYVPVPLPSAQHSFLQCSLTQRCLFHGMQYIWTLLVHVYNYFRFFLTSFLTGTLLPVP